MADNIIDLDSYRDDVLYIEYEGKIGAVTIDNIKIDFMDDSVMIDVLDGVQMMDKDRFINLIINICNYCDNFFRNDFFYMDPIRYISS